MGCNAWLWLRIMCSLSSDNVVLVLLGCHLSPNISNTSQPCWLGWLLLGEGSIPWSELLWVVLVHIGRMLHTKSKRRLFIRNDGLRFRNILLKLVFPLKTYTSYLFGAGVSNFFNSFNFPCIVIAGESSLPEIKRWDIRNRAKEQKNLLIYKKD